MASIILFFILFTSWVGVASLSLLAKMKAEWFVGDDLGFVIQVLPTY